MARETTPANHSDRLAALVARFGEEAETYYIDTPGDFAIGTVDSVGSMSTQFGPAPYVDFVLVEGVSAQTEGVTPGNRYRIAFLGAVMKGRFDKDTFVPGARFVAMNRGKKVPRSGNEELKYNNIDVRILPAE